MIGVGRWGSSDPWLGIPVTWDHIYGVRAIVETGFRDLIVTPSQGSHFFQNLSSLGIGYFTVNPDQGEGQLDWDWLMRVKPHATSETLRHLRFDQPVEILMNARNRKGLIVKPSGWQAPENCSAEREGAK